MLHGAAAPPYWPAFPVHKFGSISLCGGARSNWAHPQSMSLGKNIRSFGLASCQLPCELLLLGLSCVLNEPVACATASELRTRSVTANAHFVISPPKSRKQAHE